MHVLAESKVENGSANGVPPRPIHLLMPASNAAGALIKMQLASWLDGCENFTSGRTLRHMRHHLDDPVTDGAPRHFFLRFENLENRTRLVLF